MQEIVCPLLVGTELFLVQEYALPYVLNKPFTSKRAQPEFKGAIHSSSFREASIQP